MSDVLAEVAAERMRQDAKWGRQDHAPGVWMMILGEEVGEANEEALEAWAVFPGGGSGDWETHLRQLRAELIQVAAVCIAMVESLDRNELAVAP